MTHNEEHCVDPHAPMATCAQCGEAVWTCERSEQVGYSYFCPAHPDGFESAGKWFCNDRCGDAFFSDKAIGKVKPHC